MVTIFTLPKAFQGHTGVIQRNAIKSWRCLDNDVEVVLFGNELGVEALSRELGLRHEPGLRSNEFGTPLLSAMFHSVEQVAANDILCFVNCDIVLGPDFASAVHRVALSRESFAIVARCCNLDVYEELDFSSPVWHRTLMDRARRQGNWRSDAAVDVLAFSRGRYADMPDFAVGRAYFDGWLLWKARTEGGLIDASPSAVPIHQNHGYGHLSGGMSWAYEGTEAKRHLQWSGKARYYRLYDATHVLYPQTLKSNVVRRVRMNLSRRTHLFRLECATVCRRGKWTLLDGGAKIRRRIGLPRLSVLGQRVIRPAPGREAQGPKN